MCKKLAMLFFALAFYRSAYGQQQAPRHPFMPARAATASKSAQIGRMYDAWRGNDKNYVEIRRIVDSQLARGEKPISLSRRYKGLAQKQPTSAKAQYQWAYAALAAAKLIPETSDPDRGLTGVETALLRVKSPHSYEYDRLWFLVANFAVPNPTTRPLGERLLKRTPKDYEVMYAFIMLLHSWKNPGEKKRALGYANELIRVYPQRPTSYAALGYIYSAVWLESQRKEDATKAVAAYSKYLALLPQGDWRRPRAQRYLVYMKKWMHERARK